jgi:hypothetical protein
LSAKIVNPLNRMIVEDRKRKKYGKATGILSAILGGSLLAIAITSRSALMGLETLSNGRIAGNTFVVLDLAGAAFAILTGFLLLRFRHFSKVSFSITCGFAIFFGLILPVMQAVHSSGNWVSVVGVEGVLALVLSGAVMVLSLFSA